MYFKIKFNFILLNLIVFQSTQEPSIVTTNLHDDYMKIHKYFNNKTADFDTNCLMF